ncbi:MAG TPA: hypothetical protein VHY30_03070 [Verrucomicrobiae bacterium]|jgi:hypothetical protein|nr:hypothetical protein [Verrucomicrobiae bacterium]
MSGDLTAHLLELHAAINHAWTRADFLLVAAGQFRVAVRLPEKILPAVRGFQRRKTPAQNDARRRILP